MKLKVSLGGDVIGDNWIRSHGPVRNRKTNVIAGNVTKFQIDRPHCRTGANNTSRRFPANVRSASRHRNDRTWKRRSCEKLEGRWSPLRPRLSSTAGHQRSFFSFASRQPVATLFLSSTSHPPFPTSRAIKSYQAQPAII